MVPESWVLGSRDAHPRAPAHLESGDGAAAARIRVTVEASKVADGDLNIDATSLFVSFFEDLSLPCGEKRC